MKTFFKVLAPTVQVLLALVLLITIYQMVDQMKEDRLNAGA